MRAPAAAVAAPVPALAAGGHPDAKLLELVRECEAARVSSRAAWPITRQFIEAGNHMPTLELPTIEPLDVMLFGPRIMQRSHQTATDEFVAGLTFQRSHVSVITYKPFTVAGAGDIDRLPAKEAQQRADALEKIVEDYTVACGTAYEQFGETWAEAEAERLQDRLTDLVEAIENTPARTFEGIAATARAFHDEDRHEWEHDELITDSLRMLLADLGVVVPAPSEEKKVTV